MSQILKRKSSFSESRDGSYSEVHLNDETPSSSKKAKLSNEVDQDENSFYDHETGEVSNGEFFIGSQSVQTIINVNNDSHLEALINLSKGNNQVEFDPSISSAILIDIQDDQMQQLNQFRERNENLEKLFEDLSSFRTLLNEYQHNKSIDEFSLKEHHLPTKKCGLFTNDDLANQRKMKDNFVALLKQSISQNSDVINLLDEDERNVIKKFLKLTPNQQQLYLLLFLKKNRWTLVESINLTNMNNDTKELVNLLDNLKLSEFLLGSNDLTSLQDSLPLLSKEDLHKLLKNCMLTQQKSKKDNIISVIKFVRSIRSVIVPGGLEADKLCFVKKLLNQKIYRVNPEKSKVFLKILTTSFEPIAFDKDIYHYYSNLLANLKTQSFAQKFPVYEKNKTIELYESPEDLNRFVSACLTELDLNENNYDDLGSSIGNVLNDLESCLSTNYFKDYYEFPDFLKKFTCIGRLISCLKVCNYNLATDQSLKADAKDPIREKLNHLIDQLDFENVAEEVEEEENLDEIELKRIDLDITCAFKLRRKEEDRKKTDKQVEEELVIDEIKEKHNLESALKNQSYLFDNLFFSLFYDEIFDQTVENTFIYDYQKYPLDIGSSAFYANRSTQFANKIQKYQTEKRKYLTEVLNKNRKIKCLKFITKAYTTNNDVLKDLLILIRKEVLLSIMNRLMVSYHLRKYTCTNLLFYDMEDPSSRNLKFVEFKVNDDDDIEREKDKMFKYLCSLDLNVEIYNVQNNKLD